MKIPWEDLRYIFGEIMYGGTLAPLAQPILPSDFHGRLHGRLAKLRLSDLLFMSIRERLLTQCCFFFFPVIDVTVLMI